MVNLIIFSTGVILIFNFFLQFAIFLVCNCVFFCFKYLMTTLMQPFLSTTCICDGYCNKKNTNLIHINCPLLFFLGLDEAKRFPRVHHFVQVGAAGSPGVPAQVLAVSDSRRGTKHQELQVPTLAEPAELQQVGRARCTFLLLRIRSKL